MRYLEPSIQKDLKDKMVFLAGPRQSGKTTLALSLLNANANQGKYFNFDRDRDRKALLKEEWVDENKLLIFDELHKFKRWKNWIKGIYDTEKKQHSFLVTAYSKGGDSLLGRYHHWRLHPFSLHEQPVQLSKQEIFNRLMTVGGFPEPFLANSERSARRWRVEREERILKEDIRDLEPLKDIQTIELLVELLKTRVGSPVVVANLAADLQVAPATVAKWIMALERMYLIFVVRPYTLNIARAIQKPPKIYFFDNGQVEGDEGVRFENLVANHILKKIHFLNDKEGFRYELNYIRDKEKREVDFVVSQKGKIESLIEVKWSETVPTKSLSYFAERLKPASVFQIVGQPIKDFSKNGIRVESALTNHWLNAL